MWGGRFASGPAAIMEKINTSIDFDWHLYRQDIAASKAHASIDGGKLTAHRHARRAARARGRRRDSRPRRAPRGDRATPSPRG